MPAVPTRLPARSFALLIFAVGQRDQRGQRLLHERADRDQVVGALVARQQQLRLVGDHDVGAARRAAASAARDGSGGALMSTSRPARSYSPGRLRGVDAGVVGVGEVVEHEPQRLGFALRASRAGLALLAAAARARSSGDQEQGQGRVMVLLRGRPGCPVHDAPLQQREQAVERDGEGEQQERGGERARRSRAARWRSAACGRGRGRSPPTRRTPSRSRRRRRRS